MSEDAVTGQWLTTWPELKRFRLINLFSGDSHIVTEQMVKTAFNETDYNKIMSNRHTAWFLEDYFE